jgi:hypothetical protein
MAFCFPRNPRKSIYGSKYTKDHYLSFVFPATCSPSFVIPATLSTSPQQQYLKTFGSRVCIKRTGNRRAKLDRHDFSGIFLGYTSTDQNIIYLDLDSGLVKRSHHALFDEAWYLQPSQPPAAQLLYDLGLEA